MKPGHPTEAPEICAGWIDVHGYCGHFARCLVLFGMISGCFILVIHALEVVGLPTGESGGAGQAVGSVRLLLPAVFCLCA